MRKSKMYLVVFTLGLLFLLIINLFYIREGMETECKYKYLAPIPKEKLSNTWDNDLKDKFFKKYNEINTKEPITYIGDYSEEEAKYYIDHGEFPLNPYISDLIKNNPDLRDAMSGYDNFTPDTAQKQYSVRQMYGGVWIRVNDKVNQDKLALKIFNGESPDPCNQPTPNKRQSLLPSDMNKLKEICKRVN